MLQTILDELELPNAETFHARQPKTAFIAWGLEMDAEGSDSDNELRRYSASLELYEPVEEQAPEAHALLQKLLDEYGLPWHKDARVYIPELRLLMTGYSFEYLERR